VPDFHIVEPAIDPNNRTTFLLDWELTMKCNLDCSYCPPGIDGGHDNSTKHPELEKCLVGLDFMFLYVDLYMKRKPKGIKYVVLNVYGGESLYHPQILEILQNINERYQSYKNDWHLTVTTTTNLILPEKKLKNILPYIDEFTCSYHAECSPKQKDQFKQNLLTLIDSNKRIKCIIMMHADPSLFADAQSMIDWCQINQIKYLAKQIDHGTKDTQFHYGKQQVRWFDSVYKEKTHKSTVQVEYKQVDDKIDLSDSGRACCGGRQLCQDQNYRQRDFFIENKFPDWYCSVNEFFLFVKQVNGNIYVNKDCKMDFNGTVGPIGNLDEYKQLLEYTRENLENSTMPIIQCKKYKCRCGLCAPKAQHIDTFNTIMGKYRI